MFSNPMTWVYITFALGILLILVIAVVAWLAKKVKPVAFPYWKCSNKPNKPLMAIFRSGGRVVLEPGKYVAEVYENLDKTNPMAFFKSGFGSNRLGDCDLECFYDGTGTATSPELVVAVQELKDMGYRNINEVMTAYRAGSFGGDLIDGTDGTITYQNGKIAIPLIRQFNPAAVEDFARSKPAIIKGYSDTNLNIERANRNTPFYENAGIMSIAFLIIAACLGVGMMKAMGVF